LVRVRAAAATSSKVLGGLLGIQTGILEGLLVVIKERRGDVEGQAVQSIAHPVVSQDIGLEVRGRELVLVDEVLHGFDLLAVDHEASTDVVDLHQRRQIGRGPALETRLQLVDGLVVVALEDGLHDHVLLAAVEALHQAVDDSGVDAAHGVPELDLDRTGGSGADGGLVLRTAGRQQERRHQQSDQTPPHVSPLML
jgi:hypothetical protein